MVISVNGRGFINTSKATLTTGTPIVNGGSLDEMARLQSLPLLKSAGTLIKITTGLDGAFYTLDKTTGEIKRIRAVAPR